MMGDEVTEKIEKEVEDLQGVLKDQLKSQRDLGNLETNLQSETFTLERSTKEHRDVASETKVKMFWKNFKYYLIAGVIIVLLLLALFGPLLR